MNNKIIKDYESVMEYIEDSKQYGSLLGLDSMYQLLDILDNPQDKLKFIHIAGTNGKGSTAAFTAEILANADYSVGRYISPSVLEYEEKIQISQKIDNKVTHNNISKDDLVESMKQIKSGCDRLVETRKSHPTLFEMETALSFLYFLKKKVDVVVLEVGLGGRLDATNVVKSVLCSAFTSISMDHMDFLGDTLEAIAYEKAGIIKKNVPVVSYDQVECVDKVLREVSRENDSTYKTFNIETVQGIECSILGSRFDFSEYKNMRITLIGRHQVNNAIVSILIIEELIKQGYRINIDNIRKGLVEAIWRGRFEVLKTNPYFIVDGAHNEDAAIVLGKNLEEFFQPNIGNITESNKRNTLNGRKKLIYIIGVLKDKEYNKVLSATASYASHIITITPNNIRGLDGKVLGKEARKYCDDVDNVTSIREAITMAYQYASVDDAIITFGSLSFLYEIYKEIKSYV